MNNKEELEREKKGEEEKEETEKKKKKIKRMLGQHHHLKVKVDISIFIWWVQEDLSFFSWNHLSTIILETLYAWMQEEAC